jgi:hypothetical protein
MIPLMLASPAIDNAPTNFAGHLQEREAGRSRFSYDEYIPGRHNFMIPLSKAFPEQSLHSIANHRIAHLRTNGNSQAGLGSIGLSRNDYKIGGVLLFTGAR